MPVWRRALQPPAWFRWLFGAASLALLAWVVRADEWGTPISYAAYLSSALGAYYLVTVAVVPIASAIMHAARGIGPVRRYMEDRAYHDRVRLRIGVATNVAYASLKLAMGVMLRSVWMVAVALYYLVLMGIRAELVRRDREDLDIAGQWAAYRRCGFELLALDLTLSGIVTLAVRDGAAYSYPGSSIFAMAAYAFWRTGSAITRIVWGRQARTPIYQAATAVDASAAAVALFALQTAMFSTFAAGLDVRTPNAVLGVVVAFAITGGALMMVSRAGRQIRKIQEEEEADRDETAHCGR